MTQSAKTRRLVESGLMIALGTILSYIQFPGPWINGGSITLLSMLPITFIAYRHGVKWGFFTGMTYGLLQMFIGMNGLRGISLLTFFGAILLDYLLAFSMLGLAGIFKGKIKNEPLAYTLGTIVAGLGRFLCHLTSGYLLWYSIMEDGIVGAFVLSFVYNIGYMGPEILTMAVGALIIANAVSITSANLVHRKA